MTSTELKDELRRAGIGHTEATKLLSVTHFKLRAWIAGTETIPAETAQKVLNLPTRKPRRT